MSLKKAGLSARGGEPYAVTLLWADAVLGGAIQKIVSRFVRKCEERTCSGEATDLLEAVTARACARPHLVALALFLFGKNPFQRWRYLVELEAGRSK